MSHLGDAGLHVAWAVRGRRYDPGLVTGLVTLTPVALTGLRALWTDPEVPQRSMAAGMAAGVAVSALLPVALTRRLRRQRRRSQVTGSC